MKRCSSKACRNTLDLMRPAAFDPKTTRLTVACPGCGCIEELQLTILGRPPTVSARLCPECARQGTASPLLFIALRQYTMGYERHQTYQYACLSCSSYWEEPVVLQQFVTTNSHKEPILQWTPTVVSTTLDPKEAAG